MFTSGLLAISLICVYITQSWSVLFCQISFEIVKCEFFNLILFFKVFFFFFILLESLNFQWIFQMVRPQVSFLGSKSVAQEWQDLISRALAHSEAAPVTSLPNCLPWTWSHPLSSWTVILPWTCPFINVSSQLLSVPPPLWPQGLNPVLVPLLTLPLRLWKSLSCKCPWAVEACHSRRLQSWSFCLWTIL